MPNHNPLHVDSAQGRDLAPFLEIVDMSQIYQLSKMKRSLENHCPLQSGPFPTIFVGLLKDHNDTQFRSNSPMCYGTKVAKIENWLLLLRIVLFAGHLYPF